MSKYVILPLVKLYPFLPNIMQLYLSSFTAFVLSFPARSSYPILRLSIPYPSLSITTSQYLSSATPCLFLSNIMSYYSILLLSFLYHFLSFIISLYSSPATTFSLSFPVKYNIRLRHSGYIHCYSLSFHCKYNVPLLLPHPHCTSLLCKYPIIFFPLLSIFILFCDI